MAGVNCVDGVDGRDQEKIQVRRLHPLETLVQAFGEVAPLGVELGHQEDFLAGLGGAGEKAADAFFA